MATEIPLDLTKYQFDMMMLGHRAATADFLIAPLGIFSTGISKSKTTIPAEIQYLVDEGWLNIYHRFTGGSYMGQLTPKGRIIAKLLAP